ncbi:c-type cytochrome [Aurantivibrio infirmus]
MRFKNIVALLFCGLSIGLSSPSFSDEEKIESLFASYCFSCHGTGWEDAPVVGDPFSWEERKEQGIDILLKHTLEGLNSMPPKGGCAKCTTEELKQLIVWMIE